MPGLDLKNLPEREEDIDFSDIYENHDVHQDNYLDTVVVVDGAPIVDEAKEEKLMSVLTKLFTKNVGEIKEGGIWMPMVPNEQGKRESKGYLFIDFKTPEAAHDAVAKMDGHRMSKTHQLSVHKFGEIDSYQDVKDDYEEPELEEFEPKEHIKSWLMDNQGRDQFVVYHGDEVQILWNRKNQEPETVFERQHWTERYVQWSSRGSYLATVHGQGVALWGGPSWNKIIRFVHPGVSLLDFSPSERYLATFSTEPINLARIPDNSSNPFTSADEGNHVIIWDVETGLLLRSFPVSTESRQIMWPMFKWSPSEKYFARIGAKDKLSIYEAATMGLIDKKSVDVPSIVDFQWSPAIPDSTSLIREEVLAYWTPEVNNQPARVTLRSIPSKKIIRTKNLLNVEKCDLYWQSNGDYLAVKVDRRTKAKKAQLTNLEIFHLDGKDIPIDTLEIKEPVIDFKWEPKGQRFVIITNSDPVIPPEAINPMLAGRPLGPPTRTTVWFYHLHQTKATSGFDVLTMVDKKSVNHIYWSPLGRNLVLATLRSPSVHEIEFWDCDFEPLNKTSKTDTTTTTVHMVKSDEFYSISRVEWDPTGRYLLTSAAGVGQQHDHGYALWDFKGEALIRKNVEKCKQVYWRPRPKSLLSAEEKKKIRKNLRQFSKQFDEEDIMAGDATRAKLITERRKAMAEWHEWRKEVRERVADERVSLGRELPTLNAADVEVIEEWKIVSTEKTEEVLED